MGSKITQIINYGNNKLLKGIKFTQSKLLLIIHVILNNICLKNILKTRVKLLSNYKFIIKEIL
jgi:hypothetical protein